MVTTLLAVKADETPNQPPKMYAFPTREDAEAFLKDLERKYGVGAFEYKFIQVI